MFVQRDVYEMGPGVGRRSWVSSPVLVYSGRLHLVCASGEAKELHHGREATGEWVRVWVGGCVGVWVGVWVGGWVGGEGFSLGLERFGEGPPSPPPPVGVLIRVQCSYQWR